MRMRYRVVSDKPEISEDGELVLEPLSFVDEVKACSKYRPSNGIIAVNYLRTIAVEVGKRYDKQFNGFKHVIPTDYVGIATHTDADVAKVVEMMFSKYPQIYGAYIRKKLSDAPTTAKCVVWVGEEQPFVSIAEECGLTLYVEGEETLTPVEEKQPTQKKLKKAK
jgi:hypothetical protein